jgi:fimbrial chaperone protein
MIARKSCRHMAAARALAAIFVFQLSGLAAGAQALSVLPVNIFFAPGERATSLTVTNQGKAETAIQIRAFDWSQKGNDDQLAPTGVVVLSPPIAKLAPGATQVIRIVLRQSPATSEATYRILVDQIPPPAEPGVVHMVLRMSIPIFVQPAIRSFADVQFHLERSDGQIYLVGFNAGNLHESIRDILLKASDGRTLKEDSNSSPYILAGTTRRWRLVAQDSLPLSSDPLQLTAHANAGAIEEQVRFVLPQ